MRARSHQRIAVLDGDPLDVVVGPAEVEPLQGHAVVVAADEAVGDQHVLRVAGIDAVVVLHAGAADLDVADGHVPAVPRHDRPVRRAADGDARDLDVRAVANRDQVADGPFAPLPVGAVQDAAPADADVLAFRQDAAFTTAPPARYSVWLLSSVDLLRLVDAGTEVDHVRDRPASGHRSPADWRTAAAAPSCRPARRSTCAAGPASGSACGRPPRSAVPRPTAGRITVLRSDRSDVIRTTTGPTCRNWQTSTARRSPTPCPQTAGRARGRCRRPPSARPPPPRSRVDRVSPAGAGYVTTFPSLTRLPTWPGIASATIRIQQSPQP